MVKINREIVERLMFDRRMNQKTLVEKSGISKPTINHIMDGKPFNSETLDKLAKALDCSPIDLLDVSEYTRPHMDTQTSSLQPAYA